MGILGNGYKTQINTIIMIKQGSLLGKLCNYRSVMFYSTLYIVQAYCYIVQAPVLVDSDVCKTILFRALYLEWKCRVSLHL